MTLMADMFCKRQFSQISVKLNGLKIKYICFFDVNINMVMLMADISLKGNSAKS
jgi:hypothetical protein